MRSKREAFKKGTKRPSGGNRTDKTAFSNGLQKLEVCSQISN